MKNNKFDLLDDYFKELKIESPNSAFEDKLMQRVMLEAKKQKQKQKVILILGICSVATLLLFGFYVLAVNIDWIQMFSLFSSFDIQFTTIFKTLRIDASVFMVVVPLFLLATIDLLIRKHLSAKDKTKHS